MPANRIHKLDDGRYTYSVTVNGIRKRIASIRGESMRAFRKRCDILDSALTINGFSSEPTLDELFELWVEKHLNVNCGPSEQRTTPPIYRRHVQPVFGHWKLSAIKRSDVYDLVTKLSKKQLSKSTIDKARLCISRPFNWAINVLQLEYPNPCHGLRWSNKEQNRTKQEVRFLTEDELDRFFTAAEASKYYTYFRLLLMTGLRPSEGLGLQWGDIGETGIKIQRKVSDDGLGELKTAWAYRTVPLAPELAELLREHKKQSTSIWLFPSASGTPSLDAARRALYRAQEQTAVWRSAGRRRKAFLITPPLRFSLYNFRHTFATRLAERLPIKQLQVIMGHSDSSVTLKYYVGVDKQATSRAADVIQGVFCGKFVANRFEHIDNGVNNSLKESP